MISFLKRQIILIFDTVRWFISSFWKPNFPKFENVLVPKFKFINDSPWHPHLLILLYWLSLWPWASDLPLCASISLPEIGKNNTWFLPTSQGCCEDKCVDGRKKLYKISRYYFCGIVLNKNRKKFKKKLLWILLHSLKIILSIWFPFV